MNEADNLHRWEVDFDPAILRMLCISNQVLAFLVRDAEKMLAYEFGIAN